MSSKHNLLYKTWAADLRRRRRRRRRRWWWWKMEKNNEKI